MPKVSRAVTEQNRAKIENVSSRLIRERGLGVSVADIMGAAGMTHGGFYVHFKSKDELAAVACKNAFAESADRWRERIGNAKDKESALAALVDGYFKANKRSGSNTHCPLATLAIDVTRQDKEKPIGAAFTHGLEELAALLASVQPASMTPEECRANALAQLSTMVGAVILARATEDNAISDELIATAREHLIP